MRTGEHVQTMLGNMNVLVFPPMLETTVTSVRFSVSSAH